MSPLHLVVFGFSRTTVITAAHMLKALGHAGFDRLLLELSLPDPSAGRGSGLASRANSLAAYALQNPELQACDGLPVSEQIVLRAAQLRERFSNGPLPNVSDEDVQSFVKALERDGFVIHDGRVFVQNGFTTEPQTAPRSSEAMLHAINSQTALVDERQKHPPSECELKDDSANIKAQKVFVVHGHDGECRESVARFLEKIGLQPVILHELPSRSRTIVEKFESSSDVKFAVVILTPDDVGGKTRAKLQPRARQNVILELGYFIGRLGRSCVCVLKKGDVELPSDIFGVLWQLLDEHGAWKHRLAKEIEDAGIRVDWTKFGQV